MRALRLSWTAPACLLVLAVLGLYRWAPGRSAPSLGALATAAPSSRAAAPQPRNEPVNRAAAAPAAELPRSLRGTEVDGGLDVGTDGHLVIGPRIIALFDYFFAASGEESDAAIRARIAAYAAAHLGEPALGEALSLLDREIAYREAGRRLHAADTSTAAERLEALRRLRREHFGGDAEALFGAEERAAEVAVAKSRVARDGTLSPDEREDRLAEANSRLSEAERRARERATSALQLRADEQALREKGADDAEIHAFRAGTLGAEAAQRLDALDRRRAEWKARVEGFRRERERTCEKVVDPSACETALLERSFDERERLRVRAATATASN